MHHNPEGKIRRQLQRRSSGFKKGGHEANELRAHVNKAVMEEEAQNGCAHSVLLSDGLRHRRAHNAF